MANDAVNHPSHYTDGKIEVIDFIEDKGLNFHRGNAVKYIARAGKKNPEKEAEDLSKAIWYLNREIDRIMPSEMKADRRIAQKERLVELLYDALSKVSGDGAVGLNSMAEMLIDKGVVVTR